MKKTTTGAMVALLLLFAGACGGGDGDKAEAKVEPTSYSTLDDFRNDAVKAGLPCPQWSPLSVSPYIGEFAATCSPESVMTIYRNQSEIDQFLDLAAKRGAPDYLLVGPNWSITTDNGTLDMLSRKMGGEVVHVGSS